MALFQHPGIDMRLICTVASIQITQPSSVLVRMSKVNVDHIRRQLQQPSERVGCRVRGGHFFQTIRIEFGRCFFWRIDSIQSYAKLYESLIQHDGDVDRIPVDNMDDFSGLCSTRQ